MAKHWVDDLSDREENVRQGEDLARVAFERVKGCVENCLEIYNRRHSDRPKLVPRIESDHLIMSIMLGGSRTVGFRFMAGSKTLERYGYNGESEQGHLIVEDGLNRLQFVFKGNLRPLEIVVRETIQPVLFPDLKIPKDDISHEYFIAGTL